MKKPNQVGVNMAAQVKKEWLLEPVEIGESVVLNNVLSQRYPNRLVNFMDRFIKRRSEMPYIEYDDN